MAFDFSQPPGEPALAPQDGVAWRVFANPVCLFAGGVAAGEESLGKQPRQR